MRAIAGTAAPERWTNRDRSRTPRRRRRDASPRIRSFVVRAGRMGPGQARALATLAPRFVVPFAIGRSTSRRSSAALRRWSSRSASAWATATAAIAAAPPDIDFLGIEVHPPGVGALLQRIDERTSGTCASSATTRSRCCESMIAPASLAGIHVFFPDPWHKKRHHKRRLIQPPFVRLLASRLAPGATLHCATDWEPYAEQMLAVLSAEPALVNAAAKASRHAGHRPLTKFEQRGLARGHGVRDLVFVKTRLSRARTPLHARSAAPERISVASPSLAAHADSPSFLRNDYARPGSPPGTDARRASTRRQRRRLDQAAQQRSAEGATLPDRRTRPSPKRAATLRTAVLDDAARDADFLLAARHRLASAINGIGDSTGRHGPALELAGQQRSPGEQATVAAAGHSRARSALELEIARPDRPDADRFRARGGRDRAGPDRRARHRGKELRNMTSRTVCRRGRRATNGHFEWLACAPWNAWTQRPRARLSPARRRGRSTRSRGTTRPNAIRYHANGTNVCVDT